MVLTQFFTAPLAVRTGPFQGANGVSALQRIPDYDPQALLNPRGLNKPKPKSNGEASLGPAVASHGHPQLHFQFDGPNGFSAGGSRLDFQFDGAGGSRESDASASNGHGGQTPGASHMLENLHNVHDREAPAVKRRKVENAQNGYAQADQWAVSRGGGDLGAYVQEQREQGRKEAQGNGSAVDLTAEDDEVVILEDVKEKEVCYGRMEGADINAFKVPTPKPGSKSLSPDMWPQIKIVLKRENGAKHQIIHVADCTRSAIGCLDVNTSRGLCPILDSTFGVRTSARILARPKKAGDPPPGSEISARYNLDLNIYGPKKHAVQIGQFLSQKQLWLRSPLFLEAGFELCNPHALQNPNASRLVPGSRPAPGSPAPYSSSVRSVEEIRNDVIGMFDNLEKSETLPEMEPNDCIQTPLLKHQRQGLYFMTNKETERSFGENEADNSSLWRVKIVGGQKRYRHVITGQEEREKPSEVLGGILADMMGLGKTLSILTLVTQTLDDSKAWARRSPLTFDAEGGKLKLVQNAKTTLLVCPVSTISNWEEQIKQHVKRGRLTWHIYHGPDRVRDIKRLAEYDLVITTYGSLKSESSVTTRAKKAPSILEMIGWFRIVLDEAHVIREQKTQTFKAICLLEAQRRWAVTGTPVQNRLDDLGALFRFLRLRPFDKREAFAQYILAPCKMADPEILPKIRLIVDSITIRRLKDNISLPKRTDKIVRLKFSPEEQQVYEVFSKHAKERVSVLTRQGEKSLGGKSYVHVLQAVLRLRLLCAHGKEMLGPEDMKVMAGISQSTAIDLDSDEEEQEKDILPPAKAYEMYNLMKGTGVDTCSACSRKIAASENVDADDKDQVIGHMTACFHIICNSCLSDYKTRSQAPSVAFSALQTCQICHNQVRPVLFPLKQDEIDSDESARADAKENGRAAKKVLGPYGGPHTKTKALVADLLRSKAESEANPDPNEPPIKSVVFSGWTTHLDLLQKALDAAGIKYTRLDGKLSRQARTAVLDAFRTDPSIVVILATIGAGGVGLNLTSANKVYVMEPQYNPAQEAQAIDRVHRLGQKREVETVRYIMEDSFEVKMLQLQEKKRKLASLSMDSKGGREAMGKEEATKKRLEELRDLFK